MKAVIVAHGEVGPADAGHLAGADLLVAADGGALALEAIAPEARPHLLVGDLDSLDPETVRRLEAAGTRVERHAADKEASDTELAVRAAAAAGADEILVLGAMGGERLDHELANLLLLADPSWRGRDLSIVHGRTSVRVLHAGESLLLKGATGDLVTLLPMSGDAEGVTTTGLRWRLDAETLRMGRSRGLSNEVVRPPASVQLERGVLLVVETAAEGAT
ncbi:MAG: thiamine diphosphokinase [Candidatus Limnocylindria bacterium]